MDKHEPSVLVDTGCTDTLVYHGCCEVWTLRTVAMRTVNGGTLRCCETANVMVDHRGEQVALAALVVPDQPLGVDKVLGIAGIMALGDVSLPLSLKYFGM